MTCLPLLFFSPWKIMTCCPLCLTVSLLMLHLCTGLCWSPSSSLHPGHCSAYVPTSETSVASWRVFWGCQGLLCLPGWRIALLKIHALSPSHHHSWYHDCSPQSMRKSWCINTPTPLPCHGINLRLWTSLALEFPSVTKLQLHTVHRGMITHPFLVTFPAHFCIS